MLQIVSIELVIDILGLTQCLFLADLLASLHGLANPANRFLIAFLPIYAPAELIGLGFAALCQPPVIMHEEGITTARAGRDREGTEETDTPTDCFLLFDRTSGVLRETKRAVSTCRNS